MTTPPGPADEGAGARAQRELAQVLQQTRDARAVLEQVEADVAQARARLGGALGAPLVAVNQQLVLAMLRAQNDAKATARSMREAALSARQLALGEHEQYTRLRQANEQLVLAAISAQELQAAAEQAQRRQTDLLAVVAHELRHPLAPIRNAAAILGRIPDQEPTLGRMQAIIERQVLHMSRLVGDLLDVSRVGTGKLRLERGPLDMVAVIEATVEACKPGMDARAQRFIVRPLPATLPVDGDAVRLVQILSNILDNASKYTPNGGEIEFSAVVEGASVVMTVSDSGIGITAEALPLVFDPFVQDAHATVFNGTGLGIGLTVVRELVDAHGGTVTASSAGTGLGSRFVVMLPQAVPPVG